jgi:hypothetical protein
MTPTALLRYVNRKEVYNTGMISLPSGKPVVGTQYHTVLQQWWVSPDSFDMVTGRPAGEWRDVPIENE